MKKILTIISTVLVLSYLTSCKDEELTKVPLILSGLSSLAGVPGDTISIFGEGFGTDQRNVKVEFPASTDASIVDVSNSEIQVVVPSDAKDGVITVLIGNGIAQTEEIFYIDRIVISGNIVANTTWVSSRKYLLVGKVTVGRNITLTIEPGTVIFADRLTKASLTFDVGAQLIANGTSQKPIVFTSGQPKGSRASGDWVGLKFIGVVQEGRADLGSNNFGILTYMRIEFAGAPTNRLAEGSALFFQGLGGFSQIDHIQVSYSEGDSFRFRGSDDTNDDPYAIVPTSPVIGIYLSEVDAKYLISFACKDDDIHSIAHNGRIQFLLALRDPYLAVDNAFGKQANGIESDRMIVGPSITGTATIYSNVTYVGPVNRIGAPLASQDFGCGVFGSGVHNSIILGANLAGISTNASNAGPGLSNNWIVSTRTETIPASTERGGGLANNITNPENGLLSFQAYPFDVLEDLEEANNVVVETEDVTPAYGISSLMNYANFNNPILRFPTTSPLLEPIEFTGITKDDPFFSAFTYKFRGAFNNEDWTTGWANFDPQNTNY
jgi:hypothetical protein